MAPFLGANGFRVYCPDRPGFGLADTSKVEYLETGPKAQIDFVRMFADAVGLDQFHISGYSFGASVACNFLVVNPERILSAAFIACTIGDINQSPRVPNSEGKYTPRPSWRHLPPDGSVESMTQLLRDMLYNPDDATPQLIASQNRAFLAQTAAREAAGLPTGVVNRSENPHVQQLVSTRNRLDRLSTPMIYLFGLQSLAPVVENGFNEEDHCPNIQFFYPDECGHQGQTDQPEMFNQVFLEFFSNGKVGRSTADWAGVSKRRPELPNLVEQGTAS